MRDGVVNCSCRSSLIGLFAALILMVSGCATVSPPSVVEEEAVKLDFQSGSGPYSFACDVEEGYYDQSHIHASGDKLHAAGKMRFLKLRDQPTWAPGATVLFAGPTSKPASLGLRAFMSDKQNSIQFSITGKGRAQERTFATLPITDRWIPFGVKLSRAGDLEVSVGGQTAKLKVGATEPARLSLSCSTAVVEFSNVTVENSD